jgi:hypothetical protein
LTQKGASRLKKRCQIARALLPAWFIPDERKAGSMQCTDQYKNNKGVLISLIMNQAEPAPIRVTINHSIFVTAIE